MVKVSSAFKYKGKSYHATSDGTIAVGVHKWKGKYYYSYTSSGALRKKTGIVKWNGKRYFVQKTGRVTTSKKFSYNGKTYVAGKYGYFRTKIFTYSGNKYYANSKGEVRTKAGLFKYNGSRYTPRRVESSIRTSCSARTARSTLRRKTQPSSSDTSNGRAITI